MPKAKVNDQEHIEHLEKLLSKVREVAADCPLGWAREGSLVRSRTTTDADVVAWLRRLHELEL